MEGCVVRAADVSDRAELVDMRLLLQKHLEARNQRIWRITELGKQRMELHVDEMLADENSLVPVAELGGRLAGFAWGHISNRKDYAPESVASINLAFVRESYRRQGIGSLLVKRLCEFFETRGVDEISLNYVLGNYESEKFWSKLGFVPFRVTANTDIGNVLRNLPSF